MTITLMRALLSCAKYAADEYYTWLLVGLILKNEGMPVELWDEWSRNCPEKYQEGVCAQKWSTFGKCSHPVTVRTLIRMIEHPEDYTNSAFVQNALVIDSMVDYGSISPPDGYVPVSDMIRFIECLFKPNEYVGFVTYALFNRKGKYEPGSSGSFNRTAGEIVQLLSSCNGEYPLVFGCVNRMAGAWIRVNPLNGKGADDRNVTDYRYTLVESDVLPLSQQIDLLRSLQLPIAVLTYSGGKSVHAVVKVNAPSAEVYRQRVACIYRYCNRNGLIVDLSNSNPSRLTRFPGFQRGDQMQFIIDTEIGYPTYDAWAASNETEECL